MCVCVCVCRVLSYGLHQRDINVHLAAVDQYVPHEGESLLLHIEIFLYHSIIIFESCTLSKPSHVYL